MRKLPQILLLVALTGWHMQCSNSTEPLQWDPKRTPADLTAEEKALVDAGAAFSFKLFQEIAAHTPADSNIFIAPLSVSYALGMTYNGAAGETREEIAATLELAGLTLEEINQSYQSLTQLLTQLDPAVVITIANAIWYRIGKPVLPEFIELNLTYFDATVDEVDFLDPNTLAAINQWAEDNTNGKIKKIMDRLDPNLVFLLANAIYFKGDWTFPFDPEKTRTSPFHLASGSETECDMMYAEVPQIAADHEDVPPDKITFYQHVDFKAVSLPYGNQYFQAMIVLPERDVSIADFCSDFDAAVWNRIISGLSHEQRLELSFPKFKFSYDLGLDETLQALGMERAFLTGAADFSNMLEGGGVWIDTVIHKTFVQVDEKGTEAAAVTVVGGVESIPPQLFCDRPFLFIIYEHESGTILFMGKIANPVWED